MKRWMWLLLFCIITPLRAEPLTVEDAWIRAAPPTVHVLVGYMIIHNTDAVEHHIVSVASPAFEHIEMHLSIIKNGMAKMVPQKTLTIPAHGHLLLEPGSYHLMLFNPTTPITAGAHIELTLTDDAGKQIKTMAMVRGMDDMNTAPLLHQD